MKPDWQLLAELVVFLDRYPGHMAKAPAPMAETEGADQRPVHA
jgi:hypothetical protein